MGRVPAVLWLANAVLFLVGLSILYPSYYEVCGQAVEGAQQDCATYHIVLLISSQIYKALSDPTFLAIAATVTTALATSFIAYYTYTLRNVTAKSIAVAKQSADAAQKGAEAAARSADIAQTALVLTQRAWIALIRFVQNPVLTPDRSEIIGWRINPEWGNKGSTPTRNLRIWYALRGFDGPVPEDFDFPAVHGGNIPVTVLTQNDTTQSEPVSINAAILEKVRQQQGTLLIYGIATYNDVFDGTPERQTAFAAEVRVVSDPRRGDPLPLRFDSHAKHNYQI